jgi:hypothetical protein
MKLQNDPDPENALSVIIEDLMGELRRRGLRDPKGVEIGLRVAFTLGEKNAALKMAGKK